MYVAQSLQFKRPVYLGDTVVATVTVTKVDLDKRRVFFRTTCKVKNKIVIAQPRESVCEKGCIIMLNKKDQVRNLSVKISSTLKDAEIIYDAFCEMIEEGILAEGKLKVGNIATFEVKDVNARTGRDPRTGQPIEIAARKKVAVKIASGLKEKVNA